MVREIRKKIRWISSRCRVSVVRPTNDSLFPQTSAPRRNARAAREMYSHNMRLLSVLDPFLTRPCVFCARTLVRDHLCSFVVSGRIFRLATNAFYSHFFSLDGDSTNFLRLECSKLPRIDESNVFRYNR